MSGKVGAEEDTAAAEVMMLDEVDRSGKYGYPKEFDPKFHGPIEKRGCTDVICLLLFIAFQVGWIVVAVIAFKQGDPSVLVHPVDSWGQKCGLDPPVANKSFLYFFDITKCASPSVLLAGCPTTQVCVEKCPEEGPWIPEMDRFRLGDNSDETKAKMICQYSVDKSKYTVSELLTHNRCAKYILPVKPKNASFVKIWRKNPVKNVKSVLSRRCIPRSLSRQAMKNISDVNKDVNLGAVIKGVDKLIELLNAKQNFEFMFEDFRASWPIIVSLLVAGAVASLIWICLMRCFAGIMVWLSLVGMMFVLGFSCYFSVTKYIELRGEEASANEMLRLSAIVEDEDTTAESERFITEEDLVNQFDTALKLKNTWLTFAIVAGSLLAILLLIVLVIRSRLAIAVALIRQGARAVGDMTFALAWPLVPWVFQLVAIGFFLLVGVFLVSASEEVYRVTQNCTCGVNEAAEQLIEGARCSIKKFAQKCGESSECVMNNACQFAMYQKLSNVLYYHLYNFFGIIWMLCFISDFGDMVLAGTFAGWYWTLNRSKDLDLFPVTNSLVRTARYHLGTIAFGSLIISIIKFIRYFIEYLDYKLKQYNENPVAKAVLCCFKCCFWCLEKFMKFINRNAYIMTAVYGKNFCTSARDAFFLLMRNAVRAFVLDKVTDFLLFMGKLVIVGGVAIASFYVFAKQHPALEDEVPTLHFYLMPVIIITVGTYFITTLFFSVYNMAVDTLFLCFLEDSEVNDGSEEKPYYMPKELMGILGKKNKIPPKKQVES